MNNLPDEGAADGAQGSFKVPARERQIKIISEVIAQAHARKERAGKADYAKYDTKQLSIWRRFLAVCESHRSIALATTVILLLAVACSFLIFRQNEIQLTALLNSERSTPQALPKNLRMSIKTMRVDLFEGKDYLAGTLTLTATNPNSGTTVFSVVLDGKDSEGLTGHFTGSLQVTNAPGVSRIKKTRDITGALLSGTFEIRGQVTNHIEQSFGP
jgi:hypothetical protein